ncbi:MAG: YceI family protein [Cyclobacteriaceae bacterium]|nr:YceI family protein [Cytophagales bacterium]MBX2898144.1 YceI family protein [Cyclobacteriaceae bacterium]
MKRLNVIAAFLLLAGVANAQTTWKVDKGHSKVGFSVTHMVVAETEGKFDDYEATVVSKTDDFAGAEVSFTAKVASINTANERRDGHLKSPDFFDAEKFPEVSFKGALAKEGGKYKLKGDLTLKGVTKKVEFDVTYGGKINTGRGEKAGFKLIGNINRQDYGLTWANKTPGGELVVGDDVQLIVKVELDKAQ